MTRFRYRAVNPAGDLIEGEVDGQDQSAVVDQLRRQGNLLLATEPVVAGVEDVGSTMRRWLSQPLFGPGKVGRREVAMITRQLATMLDAGLTIDQTLRFLVDLADSEALRRLLTDLLERVQGGSTLADACAEHEGVFTRAYVSLVRAGEAGGALNEVLARLADYLENAEKLAEQVKSALVYPIILLVMAGLSIVVVDRQRITPKAIRPEAFFINLLDHSRHARILVDVHPRLLGQLFRSQPQLQPQSSDEQPP